MKRSQQRAMEYFPGSFFIHDRVAFRMGYEQAEKDLVADIPETLEDQAPAEIYVSLPKKETGPDYVGTAWRTRKESCEHIKYIRADLVER